MAQPFREGSFYQSQFWPDLLLAHKKDHLLLQSPQPLWAYSSALWGGGVQMARQFVNWKVPLAYRCQHPAEMMKEQIQHWGYPVEETIGLQTAAKLTHASVQEEEGDQFRILCCSTAGTGNAARAGMRRETFPAYEFGTINTFILIAGRLTPAAMINAIMTATEAKAAALQDIGILDREGRVATGTTSDAIVMACSQDTYEPTHFFAGTATAIGNAIGRLAYESVHEATRTQGEE